MTVIMRCVDCFFGKAVTQGHNLPSCLGIVFPCGVILHGPSGVGKSLLAQVLATEASVHTVTLSTPQLLTHDSETLLQKTFSEAREKYKIYNCLCFNFQGYLQLSLHDYSG